MEKFQDLRWNTRNTKLAAAMLVMGFLLCDRQPFTTDKTNNRTFIHFRDGGRKYDWTEIDGSGTEVQKDWLPCEKIEELWDECLAFPSVQFPWLAWMRQTLNERDLILNEIVHGKKFPSTGSFPIGADWFSSDELKLAAVLQSMGHPVRYFRDRRFYFSGAARQLATQCKNPTANTEALWRKLVLEQQEILMGIILARNAPAVRRVDGTKGRFGILPTNMPEEILRKHLRELNS